MKNAKFNIVFAAFGFLLSLIVGILSPVTFGALILRAVVFAVIFSGISVGIQVLFKIIFSNGTEDQSDAPTGDSDGKTVGTVVDITLPDEDLPNDDNAPRFFIGVNHHMLNESDYANAPVHEQEKKTESPTVVSRETSAQVTESTQASVQTQPQTQTVDENKAAFTPSPINSVAKSSGDAAPQKQLDELPNITDFHIGDEDDAASVVENVDLSDGDSEAVSSPTPPRAAPKKKSVDIDIKDTALMARAISSVLANDDS